MADRLWRQTLLFDVSSDLVSQLHA